MSRKIEKNSITETLVEIAAKHGSDVTNSIIADYASVLTNQGRDKLIQEIGKCYYPTIFANYKTYTIT